LGKRLLIDLEKICEEFEMEKVVLTVLKCKTALAVSYSNPV
jgi:hypothetical protein